MIFQEVVNQSLNFINDFMRSMLDTHRAEQRRLKIHMTPSDVLRDVLQPVAAILHDRNAHFKMLVECIPSEILIMTDPIRLKQVILNLARNATKFVQFGFVRLRAEIDRNGKCRIYVEDSGPGILPEKRANLFGKYQDSLDLTSQGTGMGLNLAKKLCFLMDGDIWLDESYHSGIQGCPGARFVVDLNAVPLDVGSKLGKMLMKQQQGMKFYSDGDNDTFATTASTNDSNCVPKPIQNIPFLDKKESNLFSISPLPSPSGSKNLINMLEQSKTNLPASSASQHTLQGEKDDEAKDSPPLLSSLSNVPPIFSPEPTTKESTSKQSPSEPQLPEGLSVLFTDDEAMLRKLFVRALKRVEPSWNIKEAACGETALDMCSSQQFDLIFMDQYMASTTKQLLGTETVKELRSRGVKTKIIGLSANDIGKAFLLAGADGFILKPFPCKKEDLTKMLLEYVGDKHEDPTTS